LAKAAFSDVACSHHALLFGGAKGPHVFPNDGANGPHFFLNHGDNRPYVATLDGAFSPPSRIFRNIHKHIPVISLEVGSAQEVKLSLSSTTDNRENDPLTEPKKIEPTFPRPPALTWEVT